MAKTNSKEISVGVASGVTWYLKLVLTESSYSIEKNQSTVTRQLYLRASNTNYTISFDNRSAWIGSNKQTIAYTQSGSSHLLFQDSVTVNHNNDGTGSYSIGFGISTSYVLSGSSTCSLTLTEIPRATTPVLSAEEFEMGTTISITLDRVVDTYTHDLYFKVGNSAKLSFAQDVGTSFDWEDNLFLVNWIDQSESGLVTIYCQTYNGEDYIGEKSVTFTGLVPESIVPKIKTLSITEATEGIASKFSAYVKEKSTLKVDITASGDYGSTIKNYKTTIDGLTYLNSNFTSEILRTSGTLTVTTTVTDTRDRTVTKTQQINVIDYYTPKVTGFNIERCDSSGNLADDDTAKYLLVTFGYDIAPVNNKNDKRAVLQYYNSTNNSWVDVANFTSVYKREVSSYKTTVEFDVDKTHEVRLSLTDFFITDENVITISREIEPTYTLINYHSSGTGMAIGTVATEEETFEVGLDNTILKDTKINGDLVIGDEEGNNAINVKEKIENLEVDSRTILELLDKLTPVVLYEGNSNGTITLSDSANNYEYIEIFFKQHQYTAIFNSVKIYHPYNVQASLTAIQAEDGGSGIASAYVVIKDTSITKAGYNIYWTNGGNTHTDAIYITRVLGYK